MRTAPLGRGLQAADDLQKRALAAAARPEEAGKRREAKRCVKRSSATKPAPSRPGQTCVTSSTMTSMPGDGTPRRRGEGNRFDA